MHAVLEYMQPKGDRPPNWLDLDVRGHQIRVDDGISAGSVLLDPPDDLPGARAQGAVADDAVARRSGEGAQTADCTSPVPVAALTTAQG
ncbi:hypothetical protein AB0O75_39135 [Streptomyces sp. NPDC088921]|uniref:hypothetical protein n=1 Tax=unclassified Streptomyces TaxID=2593676 RepID=UPI0034465626